MRLLRQPRPRARWAQDQRDFQNKQRKHSAASDSFQPASLYALRALVQLRRLADSAARHLWVMEYRLGEWRYWPEGRE